MKLAFIGLLIVSIFISCLPRSFKQGDIEPIPVRIPDFNKVEFIETNEEKFTFIVKKGDCLSDIVEQCLNDYLKKQGHQGIFRYKETLYNIIQSIETRSGNCDRIFPGEKITVRLPAVLKIYCFDYYRSHDRIYGQKELMKLLDFYWLVPYNEFNCSERTAFVEYWLENHGFNTDIVCDDNHAWCICEVQPGGMWVDIECVFSPPEIVKTVGHFKNRYENIWEALDDNGWGEWDWWDRKIHGNIVGISDDEE